MTDIKPGTWVVVADSEKALFLENVGEADYPDFKVLRKEVQDNPPDREQGTDSPGRVQESASSGARAYQETDWHELAKERFADDLAEMLYERAHKGKFERLIIVASPDVMGALRKTLHKEVTDRIVAEVAKTLTNLPLDKLEERLSRDISESA